mmetsp:Transcript_13368/g.28922  ORF Transcript_13368/g.28922 Transcript_13368/m.28922 type:complete len:138 (+) Transcript_13368:777-1190(+)
MICQDVSPATDNTDHVRLFAVVVPVQEVSAAQDSQDWDILQWVSKDNIGCTWTAVEMIEDHILAASSFADRGNIHMPKGWGDIDWVVFDLANKPAVEVGEDKAAHSLTPVRAAEGMVRLGNIHMDIHQPERVETSIC